MPVKSLFIEYSTVVIESFFISLMHHVNHLLIIFVLHHFLSSGRKYQLKWGKYLWSLAEFVRVLRDIQYVVRVEISIDPWGKIYILQSCDIFLCIAFYQIFCPLSIYSMMYIIWINRDLIILFFVFVLFFQGMQRFFHLHLCYPSEGFPLTI